MELRADRGAPVLRSSTRGRSVARIALIAAVLIASLALLAGCGAAGPAGTVDSTVAPSSTTSPPETVSPIAASGLPKLVDLGSDSCVPCQLMAPDLAALAQEYAGSVEGVILDVNKDKTAAALAKELRIRVIPTQIWFDPEGNELLRHDGYISKEDIVSRFQMLGHPLTKADTSSGQDTGTSGGSG